MKSSLLIACPWGAVTSPRTLSGIPYYLIPQLEPYFDISIADHVPEFGKQASLFTRVVRKLSKKIAPARAQRFFPGVDRERSKHLSDWLGKQIALRHPDAVLTFGLSPVGYVQTAVPIFLYLDAVYAYKPRVYDWSPPGTISASEWKDIEEVDRRGLSACKQAFFTTPTIMASAVDLYPEFRCKADSVGIGANMENVPENGPVRSYTPGSNLELILIGKSFVRKGGLVAIEACRLLRRRRIPAVIHIVGDFPEDIRIRLRHTENSDWVMYHGWIDKNETAGMQKMAALLSRSHIHLLPTQGDLSPHVICEANAFGVPTVARRVGGIPDLVKEGQSGELVADADPLKYAEAITQVLKDYSRYSANARAVYEREQRWSVVADAICRKITYHLHKTAHLSSYLGGN